MMSNLQNLISTSLFMNTQKREPLEALFFINHLSGGIRVESYPHPGVHQLYFQLPPCPICFTRIPRPPAIIISFSKLLIVINIPPEISKLNSPYFRFRVYTTEHAQKIASSIASNGLFAVLLYHKNIGFTIRFWQANLGC